MHRQLARGIGRLTDDLLIEKAQGTFVYDSITGRRLLDFTSGIGVTNTGHCHPRIVQSIQQQASQLLHQQINIAMHRPMMQLCTLLREQVMPSSQLDTFFFWNSGAEAVEAAVKLARHATQRPNIIAFTGGYHGRTIGTMSLTSSDTIYRSKFGPLMASS